MTAGHVVRRLIRAAGYDVHRIAPTVPLAPAAAWTEAQLFDGLLHLTQLPAPAADDPDTRHFLRFCMAHLAKSPSQLFQDLFVPWALGEHTGGFFVEFGATDGLALSNTWALERYWGRRGILAEPGRCWPQLLAANRPMILIDHEWSGPVCSSLVPGERQYRFSERVHRTRQ
ncbi:MAG TPA: hypothetical protein VJX92_03210 [Methylomirabilota bacterium]|nr:hypothetical protein [Methylomirabilota bacterium]